MPSLPFAVIPQALGAVATGNESAGAPATHLGEARHIGLTWRSSGATNLWVRGDFGAAREVDFVGLLSANALPATTIRLRLGDTQAEVDGTADYDSGAVAFINPAIARTDGLYHAHLELPAVQTKRWWRIDIGGHTGDFEASTLVLGRKLTFLNYYSAGFEFGVEDLGDIELTRWGVPDETPGLVFRTLKATFGWMTEADMETKFRPLVERLGRRGVALYCFDPEATVYRQAKTYFGWLQKPPFFSGGKIKPGRYESEWEILSMI